VIRSSNLNWWSQIPAFVNDKRVSIDITRALEVETFARGRDARQPARLNAQ